MLLCLSTSKGLQNIAILENKKILKCHFQTKMAVVVFQAYCKEGEWLVPGEPPTCQYNPCSDWANDKLPNWNWARNDMGAARQGPVAIIDERKCTFLGEPCAREDDKNLTDNLVEAAENPNRARNGISLMYESGKLVCSREESPDRRPRPDWTPVCRQGLYNKWKLMGRCQQAGHSLIFHVSK